MLQTFPKVLNFGWEFTAISPDYFPGLFQPFFVIGQRNEIFKGSHGSLWRKLEIRRFPTKRRHGLEVSDGLDYKACIKIKSECGEKPASKDKL